VSGRIVLHLDQGLGWTAPVLVAGCGDCGTELARSTRQAVAERTACRTRCPVCGTRTARRLPGTTSPATDLTLARGRRERSGHRRWPPDRQPTPAPEVPEGGEFPMPASPAWLTASQVARRLHVSPKTVARWASEGRLAHRRTLGGHRRFDPELIDALVDALTYRL
jgi:excisionase family DNA binding protein